MTARYVLVTVMWLFVAVLGHMQVWLWVRSSFPRIAHRGREARIIGAVLVLLPMLARWMTSHSHSPFFAAVYAITMTELMVVLIGAFPLAFVRLTAIAIGRTARKNKTPAPEPVELAKDDPPAPLPLEDEAVVGRRRAIERAGGALVLGATSGTLAWGTVIGRHAYVIEEVVVKIVGLPKALDGYTIAQASDLHVGTFVQGEELDRALSRVKETKPDLIVLTGDLVDFDRAYLPILLASIGKLQARDGIKAILGNHDYYAGADAVTEALRGAGVDLLKNDGRLIRARDGGGFALLGVDDLWAPRYDSEGPNLTRAASFVPPDRPRILLSHQPQTVELWQGKVALQLSGHTHGGQVNPGFRPADIIMRYVSGRYEVGGTTLYVNRGLGVVGPPSRVGAPPEITKIVLVSA